MGITINHKLGQKKIFVKSTLDEAQKVANLIKENQASKVGISFEIRRISDYQLYIDIGNCETLAFHFKSVKEIENENAENWSYSWAVLTDDGKLKLDEGYEIKNFPENEMYYSADFCKTQFADSIVEHKWVADILRVVASRCKTAYVSDEGEYYHSGILEDAAESIEENGKMINNLTGQLAGLGWKQETIIKGGETKIKGRKLSKK